MRGSRSASPPNKLRTQNTVDDPFETALAAVYANKALPPGGPPSAELEGRRIQALGQDALVGAGLAGYVCCCKAESSEEVRCFINLPFHPPTHPPSAPPRPRQALHALHAQEPSELDARLNRIVQLMQSTFQVDYATLSLIDTDYQVWRVLVLAWRGGTRHSRSHGCRSANTFTGAPAARAELTCQCCADLQGQSWLAD